MTCKGFSLLETTIATSILILVISVVAMTTRQAANQTSNDRDMAKLNELLHQKMAEIRSVGYWVWSLDTLHPSYMGDEDPSREWASEFEGQGIASANLKVVFLKPAQGGLVRFEGPFDGNQSRNLV